MWLGIVLYIFLNFMVLFISGQSSGLSFQNVPSLISINETTPLGTNIQQINVLNNNPRNLINVSCSSTQETCDTFKLTAMSSTPSNWNGFLHLDKTLDYTRIQSYILQLSATDNSNPPVTLSLTINVVATRYRPPQFNRTSYITEIAERNGASNEAIFTFQAYSSNAATNGFPIRYRILSNKFSSYFKLDEVLGVLTNILPLQTSNPVFSDGMASLQIEAAYVIQNVPSWGNSETSSITNATIYYSGSNLNLPTFDKSFYVGSVKETALPGTFVDTIFLTVTDLDKPLSASSFSLIMDKENDKFEIRPSAGAKYLEARISVISSGSFSYNKGPRQYSFNIIANDNTPGKTSQAAVTVNLVQVNRFAPTFFQNPYNVTISELAPTGTSVVQVKAWDEDVGPTFGNESITYRFIQRGGNFQMSSDGIISVAPTGRIYGVYPCLDYEREDLRTYTLIVQAIDILGEGLTSTATVIINLLNENDNPPKFPFKEYRGLIDDNSTVLTILPEPIKATDADGDNITYSIRDGNNKQLWIIGQYTGVLTPVRPILYTDAPVSGSFNLVIMASDGKFSNLTNVNITVKPINRYPPIFDQKVYNVTISPLTKPGDDVVQVRATDRDPPATPGGNVTYRLLSGGQDFFNVDPITGKVTLRVPLNQGTSPTYTLQIEASDQDTEPKKDATTVIINIGPSPLFIPSVVITIRDDSPVNTVVTKLTATTNEQTPDLLYAFIPPIEGFDINMNPLSNFTDVDRELFKIDGSNGTVQVKNPLNSERVPIWRSVVQVIERSSNPDLTATGTITIRITPSNKRPPLFNKPWTESSPFYNLSIVQGDIQNPEVATFIAISPNQSLSVVYQLVDPQNYFRLQAPTSGIIIQQRPFLELVPNYSFQLIAKDNGIPSLSSTATINVLLSASNVYAPVFDKTEYRTEIYENATSGSLVVKVSAADNDAGDYGVIKYFIDSSVNNTFLIDTNTGAITVAPGATFDAAKRPEIDFIVTAVDSPGTPLKQKFANALVKVTILDINNHSPTFSAFEFRIQILDTFPKDSVVIQIPATDGDLGVNAKINYAIVSGNDQGMFSIDEKGNIYLRQSLVGKWNQYVLNVTATDGGAPPLSSFCTIYILVAPTCGTACNPIWMNPSALSTAINVSEDKNVGYIIYNLSANNYLGQMGNIKFSFVNGQKTSQFENFKIVSSTDPSNNATLILDSKLNYGLNRQHSLQIEAADALVPGSYVTRFFTINVIPNLNPQFPFNIQTNCTLPVEVEIQDVAKSGTVITKVTAATRFSNDQVIYAITDKSSNLPVYINSQSGEVLLSSTAPESGSYYVVVSASYLNRVNQTTFLCNNRFDQSNINITIKIVVLLPMYTNNPIHYCFDNALESGSMVLQLNNELINKQSGEITYKSSENQYLTLTGGDVHLKIAAANIKEIPLNFKVNSTFVQNPAKITVVSTEGYVVNRATDLILVTVKKPLTDFLSSGKEPFMNTMRKYGKVCYVDASYHSTEQGIFNLDQTDVFLYIINNNTAKPIAPLELDQSFNTVSLRQEADVIGITGAVSKWDGFNYNPVAIAIGLIIGLLLLCLLFFCCCCLWPFLAKCCMSSVETEPLVAKSLAGGIMNRDWAINPQLQEQQHLSMDVPDTDTTVGKPMVIHGNFGRDYGDEDILQADSFKSTVRREDSATVDGVMSSEGLQTILPAGYVHIEAPLGPSRNASAMGTAASVKAGNAIKTITETTVQESYEKGASQGARTIYDNQEDMNRQALYSRSRKREILEIAEADGDEFQGPVQLNEVNNMGSQIGATLIKAEHVGGMTHVQNIISGSDPVIARNSFPGMEYNNYSGTLVADPSRSDMAYSNEVVFSGLRPMSRHEEIGGTLHVPRNELLLNPMNAGSMQESSYMERFEETRFL